jgi:hypothetical protein|tara:strand:+ start:517 stop:1287 length:771 start_codon:yes stop_codon:yes gene_type:complete
MNMRDRLTESVGKPHLSYSSLKYALGDMRLWEMYMRGQLKKESQALTFGSLYDMMLFEPDNVKDRFYCLDDSDIVATIGGRNPRNTKKYREWKAEALQATQNADKELVSTEEWKTAEDMIERLKVSGLYDKRFAGGKYQVEFNVDLDGVPLKGFLDCLQDDCIIDSKSSRGINKFKWDVSGWSYDIQAYIYTKVFDIKDFYWVVQEKTFPYFPADVKCSEETLFKGEMKFHEAVENINAWLDGDRQSDKHYAEFIV